MEMINESQKEAKTPKMTTMSSPSPALPIIPPWLDLAEPLTELILERLPLPDYIRFASVCPKWLSIQKEHRSRHSPFPPPMQKPLPWLVPYIHHRGKNSVYCYSFSENKLYHLRCLDSALDSHIVSASHGWFFILDDDDEHVSLLNPVSNSQIQFPPITSKSSSASVGALSAPPVNPDCIAFFMSYHQIYLFHVGQNQSDWISVGFPEDVNLFDFDILCRGAVYCNGKFYGISGFFFVVDPNLIAPSIQVLIMDCSQLPLKSECHYLVESNGDILLVVELRSINGLIEEFQVFMADLSKEMWVRVKSLGDRVLFIATKGSFSMLAFDVGCKSNCIYYAKGFDVWAKSNGTMVAWMVFDMDTMRSIDGPPFRYKEEYLHFRYGYWLLPSLEF